MRHIVFAVLCAGCLLSCQPNPSVTLKEIGAVAKGWHGEMLTTINQSYAGWDVEIGDADNDGRNEILTTGCPHSQLQMLKKDKTDWKTTLLADNLAQSFPGMGLAVKVVDLNMDGKNEVMLGTGHETGTIPFFYVFNIDNNRIVHTVSSRPEWNKSSYTHDLAAYDLDHDGLMEAISAYCGNGEIIRYDVDSTLSRIDARLLHKLSGSGEESLIIDVDNDGEVEYITSNSFRHGAAQMEIYEFDQSGELVLPPRIVIKGYDGKGCFYASAIVGDVDNDNRNELIIGWKEKQDVNKGTILGYRIDEAATPIYTFAYEDPELDLSYFEKMLVVADADNDGHNDLVVSTRGDEMSERITSKHYGHVFMYQVGTSHNINKTLLVDFNDQHVESSWVAVGDADNDGKNEVVLATGRGDRTKAGTSFVVLLKKE
jgi:hypothetical protein